MSACRAGACGVWSLVGAKRVALGEVVLDEHAGERGEQVAGLGGLLVGQVRAVQEPAELVEAQHAGGGEGDAPVAGGPPCGRRRSRRVMLSYTARSSGSGNGPAFRAFHSLRPPQAAVSPNSSGRRPT